jgi:hypothetical protein
MASALQQDWENYNPNNQTALRSPSYWDAVKENIPHQLTGLSRVGTNALGFPVDIVNLGLDATDATYNLATGKTGRHLSSDYPFMGSRNFEDAFNIPERTGNPTDFWSEIGGEFLLPTGQGLARSALKAEEFLSKIVKDKLPEVVGKNVPELFKTPITGLNIKPKDSALSPNLTKQALNKDTKTFLDYANQGDSNFNIIRQIFNTDIDSARDTALVPFLKRGQDQFSVDPISVDRLNKIKSDITKQTQDYLKDLPEELTVYRIGDMPSNQAKSFTLDKNYKAKLNLPWAERKGEKLISYKVNKKDILASPNILRRGNLDESEIIINTNKVTKQAPKVDLSMRRQTNDFIDAMENDDLIFVGGVPSGNSRAGEIRRRYVVFDAKDKSKQLGEFEVFTDDKTNNFLGLVELKVKDKRKGTGKKIIDSLMQSDFVNDDFRIHSVLKASIPFWKKMGTKFPEEDLRKFEKMKGHVRDKAIPLGIISKHSPK